MSKSKLAPSRDASGNMNNLLTTSKLDRPNSLYTPICLTFVSGIEKVARTVSIASVKNKTR
ncbi:hypothetical protein [uncultured Lactobacillus sp.]|uniref:hypothetical protein n=1 Tax=uncultured Lactobacillus sp. TaxID=153152 RepID=UPI0025E41082|nr:hypothetical protein [uncultured Lactobacillus sp.]